MACVTKELIGKIFFLLYHFNLITSRLMMLLMI